MKKKLLLFGAAVIVIGALIVNANPKTAYAVEEQRECKSVLDCKKVNGHFYTCGEDEGEWFCCAAKADVAEKRESYIPPPSS